MFVISKTHVGMVRTVNEDALLTTGPELFALADGMGGYAAGETASREALQVLQQEAEKFKELTGTELCTAMRETVQQANKHIRQMAQNEIQYHDMGTTLVAVYLAADGKAYAVNVGDSRLYVIGEDITQITRDHSLVEEMVQLGQIDRKAARTHEKKNYITRAIGGCETVEAEMFSVDLNDNDIILMCSDGLTNMLEDAEILSIVRNNADIEDASRMLIDRANENGGKDNISVIIVEL